MSIVIGTNVAQANTTQDTQDNNKNYSHPNLPKSPDDLDKLLSNDRILYYGNSIEKNVNLTQEQKDALQQVVDTGDSADIDLPVVGLTNIARLTKDSGKYLVMEINGHKFAFEASSLKYQFQVDKKDKPTEAKPLKPPTKAFDAYIKEPLNVVTAKLSNISFEVRQPSEANILNYLGSDHIQKLKGKEIDSVRVSVPPFGVVDVRLDALMKNDDGKYSDQLTYNFYALGATHNYRYPTGSFIKSEKAITTPNRLIDLTK